ncbi:MotA/TolQ/ExbB proton channel family protein [Candidatus Aminicenantes bacterium AC-335-B20]|jgi:biopolymer transport protein ExbB/TolQ|nr:MotA/TolQ/ExbB proton channel family protein [SCandidatus Aminicenantes bacterium Aminicenantia_JdfR_composite]MCP2597641.1 MotA/TolQ/ExbB proton channel family protein [Candidatus Aminicenantes bacterium AC-335-G13]MCP2599169.1 MotA/TolQ/ExbB proton channel family protein [Candidatus Aminicenantes bacterium AC-335-B20]MCP2605522.1 MotA/TolQ/ExbB proton channel family protein [Candidatus Aminicenantes bacterium AC-335-O07]MCP2619146.1 MotA/TolQ/ExbB proton channel family protein [Candidatus 
MEFGLIEMWQAMGAVAKGVAIILIALSIVAVYLFIERNIFYNRTKKKSKEIAPKLANLLKQGKIEEALEFASKKENRVSHLAQVTAAGIREYLAGKESNLSFEEQIETCQRGCERATTIVVQQLRRGLSVLATISTSAPFIGLFGTIAGIINAFRGMALTGSGGIGAVAQGIAEALVTTAFGIGVAVIAVWCFNLLLNRVDIYAAEMANTTSELVDFFVRQHEEVKR